MYVYQEKERNFITTENADISCIFRTKIIEIIEKSQKLKYVRIIIQGSEEVRQQGIFFEINRHMCIKLSDFECDYNILHFIEDLSKLCDVTV